MVDLDDLWLAHMKVMVVGMEDLVMEHRVMSHMKDIVMVHMEDAVHKEMEMDMFHMKVVVLMEDMEIENYAGG